MTRHIRIACLQGLSTILMIGACAGSAHAFDFQAAKPSADQPVRVDTAARPEDAFAKLSPASGKTPSRAALIVDLPNPSYWTPYIGAGAGMRNTDPFDVAEQQAEYNFMAGTMLQTTPDKKGRQHQFTVGYRYNDVNSMPGAVTSSNFAREQSHNLEMDWRFKF
jgi:hypothetical protein